MSLLKASHCAACGTGFNHVFKLEAETLVTSIVLSALLSYLGFLFFVKEKGDGKGKSLRK